MAMMRMMYLGLFGSDSSPVVFHRFRCEPDAAARQGALDELHAHMRIEDRAGLVRPRCPDPEGKWKPYDVGPGSASPL
jgi:hypothetical protein